MESSSETRPDPIVRVPVKDLLRVAPFKGHDDLRYYLNGILVTPYEGHALLIATNGHWLAIYESREAWTDQDRILDVPTWFLDQAKQLQDHGTLNEPDDWIDDDDEPPRRPDKDLVVMDEKSHTTLKEGAGAEVLVKPGLPFIDGKFPDWRKVLPDPSTLEKGIISPFAVNYFSRLGEAVPPGRGHGIYFFQCRENGGSGKPGIFRFSNLPGFVLALMPMRDDQPMDEWPEWMMKAAKEQAA